MSSIKIERPQPETKEISKEITIFDYSKESSCETKEHSNCGLSEKSEMSAQINQKNIECHDSFEELRKKVKLKFCCLLEHRFPISSNLANQISSEIESRIFSSNKKAEQNYLKSFLILFRAVKKGILTWSSMQKTRDFNIASLGFINFKEELKLALNENSEPHLKKELKENSLGVLSKL